LPESSFTIPLPYPKPASAAFIQQHIVNISNQSNERMSDQGNKRWITPESQENLSSLLALPDDICGQDWDLECADAGRVEEFLDVYERHVLNDDDRFALMALIVASLDDYLFSGATGEALLQRVRQHLVADYSLHKATITYWSLPEESDNDNLFHITPLMREVMRVAP
jgi:hypothetical protein